MIFHLLGIPHTISSKEYISCPFTQKVVNFAKMMKDRGHTIIHYGHERSNLICDEHVTVTTDADMIKTYGNYDWKNNSFQYNSNSWIYNVFKQNAIQEIAKRKQKNDFLLPFFGNMHKDICDAHPDIITVEPGIGYVGYFANHKVFESYAMYHAHLGMQGVVAPNPEWYNAVIPNYFDPSEFDFAPEKKEDYFLFIGRVNHGKGIDAAVQTTEKIGAKLIVAGVDEYNYPFPPHVEYIGFADLEKRKHIMSRAKGAFVPTFYVEPFGAVLVELLFSGTPVITTDWGAFVENNVHGLTGYRCRNFDQFVWAARNIDKIDPFNCRKFAMENFSMERVGAMYEEYFSMLINYYGKDGWYYINQERTELDWLKRYY